MKFSIYFTPNGLTQNDVAGHPVLVIDVLRTTTTIVTALGNGAKAVLPAETATDAMQLSNNLERDGEEALARMSQALDSFIIEGVKTTIPFLRAVIHHPEFKAGAVDTKFLERNRDLLPATE